MRFFGGNQLGCTTGNLIWDVLKDSNSLVFRLASPTRWYWKGYSLGQGPNMTSKACSCGFATGLITYKSEEKYMYISTQLVNLPVAIHSNIL